MLSSSPGMAAVPKPWMHQENKSSPSLLGMEIGVQPGLQFPAPSKSQKKKYRSKPLPPVPNRPPGASHQRSRSNVGSSDGDSVRGSLRGPPSMASNRADSVWGSQEDIRILLEEQIQRIQPMYPANIDTSPRGHHRRGSSQIISPQPRKQSTQKILQLTGMASPSENAVESPVSSLVTPSHHNSSKKIQQLMGLDISNRLLSVDESSRAVSPVSAASMYSQEDMDAAISEPDLNLVIDDDYVHEQLRRYSEAKSEAGDRDSKYSSWVPESPVKIHLESLDLSNAQVRYSQCPTNRSSVHAYRESLLGPLDLPTSRRRPSSPHQLQPRRPSSPHQPQQQLHQQRRPSSPNHQQRPSSPHYQRRPASPNFQQRPMSPHYQQPRPSSPHYQQPRPSSPHYQQPRPSSPHYQQQRPSSPHSQHSRRPLSPHVGHHQYHHRPSSPLFDPPPHLMHQPRPHSRQMSIEAQTDYHAATLQIHESHVLTQALSTPRTSLSALSARSPSRDGMSSSQTTPTTTTSSTKGRLSSSAGSNRAFSGAIGHAKGLATLGLAARVTLPEPLNLGRRANGHHHSHGPPGHLRGKSSASSTRSGSFATGDHPLKTPYPLKSEFELSDDDDASSSKLSLSLGRVFKKGGRSTNGGGGGAAAMSDKASVSSDGSGSRHARRRADRSTERDAASGSRHHSRPDSPAPSLVAGRLLQRTSGQIQGLVDSARRTAGGFSITGSRQSKLIVEMDAAPPPTAGPGAGAGVGAVGTGVGSGMVMSTARGWREDLRNRIKVITEEPSEEKEKEKDKSKDKPKVKEKEKDAAKAKEQGKESEKDRVKGGEGRNGQIEVSEAKKSEPTMLEVKAPEAGKLEAKTGEVRTREVSRTREARNGGIGRDARVGQVWL